ncbi:hypothetical protein LRAMOSA06652 [Lichtheimia ramosa]|uniref:Uncharacterized protein n=1 Tax=Lichtheimia ramosa TaxID=688394 RepID=A0A077X548_9FUNG|nr:hypothetical protein LRAMOSA06652 [Lichtheimia ramosa]
MVIILPWPLDALFFKFQGLSTDFALGIDLYRLYRHNRRLAKDSNLVTVVVDTDANGKERKQRMQPVHFNLMILAIAANLHTFGNTLVTVGNHMLLWIIFQFLYAISFPMYAYYVVSEPNDQRVQWYPLSYVKEALVMISAVVSCGLFIVIGAINSGLN